MKIIEIDELRFEPFISYEQIKKRIRLIAIDINLKYEDRNPVFVGVLNGCFMFMADLMKEINIDCEMSFVKLASYHGTAQGHISQLIGIGVDLTDREVIIVEDVIDTGNSLKHTIVALQQEGAKHISVCSLLMKPSCLQYDFDNIEYVGFEIDKEFVVGYGLDYNGHFRNLKDIYKEVTLGD
ncbi:hypoxanthine phosphoribosyltransferase [Sphingobacterium bovistauri]|uniref:Hypoxanthine phosphoribosyltransferase n=1 Tax=Sphingobacterium bovistauri TaxID=2781959 RepID=A0ABS7Z2F4_9SPHI|nr:hypoxanthine phosphoribosyltransferase [Sphingobacterium bovistauri]MCA5004354.1 hypoxanthine phosphoribosyltransferase [Sphingobacterium bovistauri]